MSMHLMVNVFTIKCSLTTADVFGSVSMYIFHVITAFKNQDQNIQI